MIRRVVQTLVANAVMLKVHFINIEMIDIQNGVIEPCSSAYASQVLVVRKKDGSPRVCIDFRKLNRVLVKDHYPLPLIEDILDKLQDTRVFSTIDLRLPRANGQVERINRTIIPVLSKMSEDDPTKWFKHVPSLQEVLNSTFQRSINTTPFELLFGTQINNKTDLRIQQLIDEQLQLEFNENRELLRKAAKTQILKVQNENKKVL
ncbi:transposon Tf2-8 polyprotein [Trichonephila clavipes]|nr:transposon Tf2-8 polyprotein [Trichonephila clavipes]